VVKVTRQYLVDAALIVVVLIAMHRV